MSGGSIRTNAYRFVERFQLHSDSRDMVNLSVLFEEFRPILDDLSNEGILGYGLFILPVSLSRPAEIHIERGLPQYDRRLVYTHEVGHYICDHISSPMTHSISDWHYAHDEREAWIAAAFVLIPGHLMLLGLTIEEIAQRAGVPVWIVQLYRNVLLGNIAA